MPLASDKQKRFFGAELGRREKGEKPKMKMSTSKIKEYFEKDKESLGDIARKHRKKKKRG